MRLIPPLPANAPERMQRFRRFALVVAVAAAALALIAMVVAWLGGSSLFWFGSGLAGAAGFVAFLVFCGAPPVLWSRSRAQPRSRLGHDA
jgi:peptidoglycan/LPS O-acetylase OafA/YrhL